MYGKTLVRMHFFREICCKAVQEYVPEQRVLFVRQLSNERETAV